jgi:glycerophosphoryl diester phosphodiesterase
MTSFLNIGHRGAPALAPENTLLSFQTAIKYNVDMIECDVHLTKDNIPIIMHDDTLDRTTTGRGKISNYTLKQLQSFKTKNKHQPIPTAEQVIRLTKHKCQLNIEIKGTKPAAEIAKLITKHKAESYVLVSGNSIDALQTVKRINPYIKTALIFWATKTDIGQYFFDYTAKIFLPITKRILLKRATIANVQSISLGKPLATKSTIKFLHQHNFKVYVWTINTKKEITIYKSRCADGVFCNDPREFR